MGNSLPDIKGMLESQDSCYNYSRKWAVAGTRSSVQRKTNVLMIMVKLGHQGLMKDYVIHLVLN